MRAGQWVAFDASTEKPHKCGKKNKADPAIKKLAKKKNNHEEEINSINLGYESEMDNEIQVLEERLEEIKIKEKIETAKDKSNQKETEAINPSKPQENEKIYQTTKSNNKDFEKYFWIFVLIINALAVTRCVSD